MSAASLPAPPHAAFAARLKSARLRTGLSQQDIAVAVGTSRRTWLRWEGGYNMPSTAYMVRIAEATGQPTDKLTGAVIVEQPSSEDDEEAEMVAALMSLMRRAVRAEMRAA